MRQGNINLEIKMHNIGFKTHEAWARVLLDIGEMLETLHEHPGIEQQARDCAGKAICEIGGIRHAMQCQMRLDFPQSNPPLIYSSSRPTGED